MSSFIRIFCITVALLAVVPVHASIVQGVIVGIVGQNSTDTQGLFGPSGAILDGKTVSILYSYDTDEFRAPHGIDRCPDCVEYDAKTYFNDPSFTTSSISVTIDNITVRSSNYPYYDHLIFYPTNGDFQQVSGYGPQVQLYIGGLDTPHFGFPISLSSRSVTGWVNLTPAGAQSRDASFLYFNANPCATVIANGLQGPTLSGDDPNLPTTTIKAQFTPTMDGITPYGLANAAKLCGVEKFNWVQIIKSAPDPLPFCVNSKNLYYLIPNPQPFCGQTTSSSPPFPVHLTSLSTPFFDPPPNGYTYINQDHPNMKDPEDRGPWDTGPDAYPFYYDTLTHALPLSLDNPRNTPETGNTLNFSDMPTDPCISGPSGVPSYAYLNYPSVQADCGNPGPSSSLPPFYVTPENSIIKFWTFLAGVKADNTPLIFGPGFVWQSNFNGTAGGIATTVTIPGQPADPNGVGGITVTNVSRTTSYSYQGGSPVGPNLLTGSQIAVRASGLAYSRVTQTFNGTVTITNVSSDTIAGPLSIVLDSLTTGTTALAATGNFGGWSYFTIPGVTSLAPGQSATVSVQFKNPSNAAIRFTPLTFNGSFTN